MSTMSPAPSAPLPAWRPALVWAVLSALGAAAVTPYLLSLLPKDPSVTLPPLPVLLAAQAVQTGVLAFLLAWGGTAAGRTLGVGSPLLEALLRGQRPGLPRSLALAALWGVLTGLAIVGADSLFAPLMPAPTGTQPQPTPWQGLLASLYGGIAEEVLMRLGLATLLAWGASRVLGTQGRGRLWALGLGIAGAMLLFGAGHLPAAAMLWPLTPVVVARTLLLNGMGGVVFGLLYARRGLEHAMAAHLCADLVLHVFLPALRSG